MTNPTEKASASHSPLDTSHSPQDEPWIDDVMAQTMMIEFKPDLLHALCEGESIFCEQCGEKFPLWPIQTFAAHAVDAHAGVLTLQVNQANMMLCTAGLTDASKNFLAMQLCSRTALRRRARDLGLITFCDAQGNPLPKETKRIIQ